MEREYTSFCGFGMEGPSLNSVIWRWDLIVISITGDGEEKIGWGGGGTTPIVRERRCIFQMETVDL